MSYYYYGYYLAEPSSPNPFMTKWGVNVPLAFANNCRFWQPETITNFETALHAHWLGLRLAWNPRQKPADVFDELHKKFYGAAAERMAAYWRFIDEAWVNTPEYSGCGFGHLRRFTPSRLAEARGLMDRALAAAKTPAETFRVGMANDSLRLFERFMRLRRDLAEVRFANLAKDAAAYRQRVIELCDKYEPQYAFGRMPWTRGDSIYGRYFGAFYQKTYDDAARVANEHTLLVSAPRWRYRPDKSADGENQGFAKADFDDSQWKSTEPVRETWSTLGLHNYMGSLWYRQTLTLPELPRGKKVYLWSGATDGAAKVFVNGRHAPYANGKGQPQDAFSGYCQPASFDVTSLVRSGEKNQFAILCTRSFLNELGTGGLLAPVVLYGE